MADLSRQAQAEIAHLGLKHAWCNRAAGRRRRGKPRGKKRILDTLPAPVKPRGAGGPPTRHKAACMGKGEIGMTGQAICQTRQRRAQPFRQQGGVRGQVAVVEIEQPAAHRASLLLGSGRAAYRRFGPPAQAGGPCGVTR